MNLRFFVIPLIEKTFSFLIAVMSIFTCNFSSSPFKNLYQFSKRIFKLCLLDQCKRQCIAFSFKSFKINKHLYLIQISQMIVRNVYRSYRFHLTLTSFSWSKGVNTVVHTTK